MLYLNLLPVTFLIIIWSHQWIKPSGSVFLFLTSFLLFVISCFWALSLPYLPPSPQSRSSHHSFFHSTSDFHQGSLTGVQCKYFSHKSGIFFLINSNSHESALTCSILCRLRDILKHTLSNLFPFSQQQRFALPHFHGHCKPPFHSWPLLSTLQLVACFQTALTTVRACGLSEKERVRFGEEFLRGVGGWYLGHPPLTLSPKLLAANCPEAFCFRLLRLWAEAAMQFNDKQLSHCPQLQSNQRLRTILSCKQDTHRDQSWLLGRICRPREMQLLPLVLFWSEAVHGSELRIFIWFFSLKHETFASYYCAFSTLFELLPNLLFFLAVLSRRKSSNSLSNWKLV